MQDFLFVIILTVVVFPFVFFVDIAELGPAFLLFPVMLRAMFSITAGPPGHGG